MKKSDPQYRRTPAVEADPDAAPLKGCGEANAGFLSRITFWWKQPTISLAGEKVLELEDGEVESMAAKLKPVQERKFRKALASLQ